MTLSPRTKTRLLLGTAGLMLSTISPALAYETCSILDLEPGEVCSPGTRDNNDTYVSSAYSTTWNGLLVSGYSGVSDNARSFLWDLKTGEITTIPLTPESGTTFALGHYMSLNGKTSAYREYTTGINDDAIGIVYDWENDLRYETPLLDPNGSARSIYLSGDGRTSFTSATDPSDGSPTYSISIWMRESGINLGVSIRYDILDTGEKTTFAGLSGNGKIAVGGSCNAYAIYVRWRTTILRRHSRRGHRCD